MGTASVLIPTTAGRYAEYARSNSRQHGADGRPHRRRHVVRPLVVVLGDEKGVPGRERVDVEERVAVLILVQLVRRNLPRSNLAKQTRRVHRQPG